MMPIDEARVARMKQIWHGAFGAAYATLAAAEMRLSLPERRTKEMLFWEAKRIASDAIDAYEQNEKEKR
ncbi:MAG: hypothetical protein IT381_21225 [Deltaproteobacteria bacterium]|nr:hypothetical protein [Deltaproteobacteria bacterium]